MAQFVNSFMGNAGFEELKTYTKQSSAFCKEIIAVIQERATAEQLYAKSLSKCSQRLHKASSSILLTPLTTSWKKVATEMQNESDVHKQFSGKLQEECLKPLEQLVEREIKMRKNIETGVENFSKIMSEKFIETNKIKKRLYTQSKDNEALIDQINGPRPKTEKDQLKLTTKQAKTEELVLQSEKEYYSSLIALESTRQDWEITTFDACQSMQAVEEEKIDHLCRLVCLYNSTISSVTSQLETCSHNIRQITSALDPDGEIIIVAEKKKSVPYFSEQVLCDYYEENLNNRYPVDKRKTVLCRAVEKFLGDIQKNDVHYNGIKKLESAPTNKATGKDQRDMKMQLAKIATMKTFLNFNKYKLQKTIQSLEGRTVPTHDLYCKMQQYTDKQGVTHSVLKRPLEDIIPTLSTTNQPENNQVLSKQQSIDPEIAATRAKEDDVIAGTLTAKQVKALSSRLSVRSSKKVAPPPPINNTTFVEPSAPPSDQCMAKYDYVATQPDELSFKEGQIINVIKRMDDGWWKGEIGGVIGVFPQNYVS